MSHFLTNINPTPVMAELVELASKHTGLNVTYSIGGQTYAEMDFFDAAEAYDDGYVPDPTTGALFAETKPGTDLGPFWDEFDRLRDLIKTPLNEPVLADDYPMYGGYMYVIDGKLKMCDHFDGEMNTGITVMEYKRRYGDVEIRRCDIVGRQQRLPLKPERSDVDLRHRWKHGGRTINQAQRKRRSSNKIKKVR